MRPKSCLWKLGPALALPSLLPQDLGAHQASVPTSLAARHETFPQDSHLLVLKSWPFAELPAEPPAVPFSYAYTSLRVWPKEV